MRCIALIWVFINMQLSVKHITTYHYDNPPQRSTQIIRLTPFHDARQKVLQWQVNLPGTATTFTDAFGNFSHLFCLESPQAHIEIVAQGIVDVHEREEPPENTVVSPLVFLRPTPLTTADAAISAFAEPMRHLIKSRPILGLMDLMMALLEKMPYTPGGTTVSHTAAESFATGRGVCQDHAHVFISCCRYLGIPARYISGYIYSPNQEEVASHAWADAWLGNRWASFDVSNAGGSGHGAHIRLAQGLDYQDACPIRGVRLGGENEALSTRAEVKITQ